MFNREVRLGNYDPNASGNKYNYQFQDQFALLSGLNHHSHQEESDEVADDSSAEHSVQGGVREFPSSGLSTFVQTHELFSAAETAGGAFEGVRNS